MKRTLQRFGLGLIIVLVLIQFIRPDHTNPPIDASRTIQARTQIPPPVMAIVQRACDDCHSNHTVWPWYSQINPIAWYLQHDVQEGRQELNLSDWAAYDQRRATRKLNQICEEVTKGAMPTMLYMWLHPSARLSEADRQALCDWTRAERQRLQAATRVEPDVHSIACVLLDRAFNFQGLGHTSLYRLAFTSTLTLPLRRGG